MAKRYDGVLMIAFGGPAKQDEVMPFLRNVAHGRNIPDERLEEVAHHYELIGGKSPLNELTFKQAVQLERELVRRGHRIPVFVGMRNWDPYLPETISRMAGMEIKRAVGLIMAAYQSDSSWTQYKGNVASAIEFAEVDLDVEYASAVFDHPLYIEAIADNIAECVAQIPDGGMKDTRLVFTAHSIPTPMADASPYVEQLTTASGLVAERLGLGDWTLAYQSRSGRPQDAWLEPDICDVIRELPARGVKNVIVHPIGFVCDHVEVLYDIGIEAREVAEEVGVRLIRARSVNADAKFISALADRVMAIVEPR